MELTSLQPSVKFWTTSSRLPSHLQQPYHLPRHRRLPNHKNVPICFHDIPQSKKVVFRIIKAKTHEKYDDLTKQWLINKLSFDQGHHTEYNIPYQIQQQKGPSMRYGEQNGVPQDFRQAPTNPNLLRRCKSTGSSFHVSYNISVT